jgi:hypothetical protein
MYNYPNFLNLLTTFAYIPLSFAYIIPALRYGRIDAAQASDIDHLSFFVLEHRPASQHRERIDHLSNTLTIERPTARAARAGRGCRSLALSLSL